MSTSAAADRSFRILLTGRSRIGDVVVGVVCAAMDERIGGRVAELHLARPGHPGRRVEVREGQMIGVGALRLRVVAIRPYTGRGAAAVALAEVADGAAVSRDLG